MPRPRSCLSSLLLALSLLLPLAPLPGHTAATNLYQFRPPHPDGIGKLFHGREIAHVMSHEAAPWLDRPEREAEERPALLIPLLHLKPGHTVADVGAGSGFFTRRLAQAVAPAGRVLAVDIQPQLLQILTNRLAQSGITNVLPILGTARDPHLPTNAIDLALLVDVYHELEFPHEMLTALARALRPDGRLVLVEYRGEDPAIPITPSHKMTEAQVRRELEASGFEWIKTHPDLPRQHVLEFRKAPPRK